jgi:hypothetical protein
MWRLVPTHSRLRRRGESGLQHRFDWRNPDEIAVAKLELDSGAITDVGPAGFEATIAIPILRCRLGDFEFMSVDPSAEGLAPSRAGRPAYFDGDDRIEASGFWLGFFIVQPPPS